MELLNIYLIVQFLSVGIYNPAVLKSIVSILCSCLFPWFWTVSDHMIPQAVETLVAPALLLDFDHRLLYSKPL